MEVVKEFTLEHITSLKIDYGIYKTCFDGEAKVLLERLSPNGRPLMRKYFINCSDTPPPAVGDNPDAICYRIHGFEPNNGEITVRPGIYRIIAQASRGQRHSDNSSCRSSAGASITILKAKHNADRYDNMYAGGFRIARQIICSENSNESGVIKEYKYTDQDHPERSSGTIINKPIYNYNTEVFAQHPDQQNFPGFAILSATVLSSQSNIVIANTLGNSVGYGTVLVKESTDRNNGYTIQKFTTSTDYPDINILRYPFPPSGDKDWKRGALVFRKTANQLGQTLLEETINYSVLSETQKQLGVKIALKIVNKPILTLDDYLVNPYSLLTGFQYIQKKEVIDFAHEPNGVHNQVKSESFFIYDNPLHLQVTRSIVKKSNNQRVITCNTYPEDYTDEVGFISDLKKNHIVTPVESVTLTDDYQPTTNTYHNLRVTQGQANTYLPGGKGLVDKTFLLKNITALPIADFKLSNKAIGVTDFATNNTNFSIDSRYEERISFDLYDTKNNLIQITSTGSSPTSYLWGYNSQYPVAEIKNATYQQVKTALGITDSGDINLGAGGLSAAQKATLRANLPQAMITTYDYAPLIGMTSATDPNGVATFYEYDDLQRLKAIKDKDGNVLKTYEYHYKQAP